MSKTFFKGVIFFITAGILAFFLYACTTSTAQEQSKPFIPDPNTLEKAGTYSAGESIETSAAVAGQDKPTGKEISVDYPSIKKLNSLPEGVDRQAFKGGTFDDASAAAMEERLGFLIDQEGDLPDGYSYILVQEKVKNIADTTVGYDVSKGYFAVVDKFNELLEVGTEDPLWHDAWSGSNPKQYFIVSIDPEKELFVTLLYILPNDAIVSEGLVYVVDSGNASSEEGFVGLKAFDVAGQIESQEAL